MTKYADVVVIGGGAAGVGAAVEAARKGLKVYLLEASDLLGGIMAKSFGMMIDGAYPTGKPVGGLITEYLKILYNMNPPAAERRLCLIPGFEDGQKREVVYDPDLAILKLFEMVEDAGVNLLLNTTALDVVMEDNRVKSIVYYDRAGRHFINTKIVIDCSGDGDIGARAGVPFSMGDEEGNMMGATLTFFITNVDVERAYKDIEEPHRRDLVKKGIDMGALKEDTNTIYMIPGLREGTVYFNCVHIKGIDGTKPEEISKGAVEARKRVYQLAEFVKKEVPGFENAYIESIAPTLGIRETRRFEGMYTMTADDVFSGSRFKDGIVCCDCTVDDVVRGKGKDSKVRHTSLIERGLYYQVPFRTLVPKEIENLLFAGRCFSAELVPFASARGISTCMIMGQACGAASDLAIRDNSSVQDIDFTELVGVLNEEGVNGIGKDEL